MGENDSRRELDDLRAEQGAERYRQKQRKARQGSTRAEAGARPMEFNESGFPIAQRRPSFVERVARLLYPR